MSIAQIIPWSIAFVSLVIAVLSYFRTGNKDKKEELTEEMLKFDGLKESLIKANMKLDQVCATTNETRTDIKSLNNSLTEIDKRVCVLERDLKTAFTRIDELKGDR